jgi:hypothetical protein
MPATIIPFTPATSLFEPAAKRNCALTTPRTKGIHITSRDEPETRLWKVCARQGSLWETIIELFVFAVFLLIALALVAGCLAELPQLLQRDAIGYVAREALERREVRADW